VDVYPTRVLVTVDFTGNFAWADPKSGIVYVFLSNRVYPTMTNTALADKDVRTKTQQIIQDAIILSDKESALITKPKPDKWP